jgi:hypothetical protein
MLLYLCFCYRFTISGFACLDTSGFFNDYSRETIETRTPLGYFQSQFRRQKTTLADIANRNRPQTSFLGSNFSLTSNITSSSIAPSFHYHPANSRPPCSTSSSRHELFTAPEKEAAREKEEEEERKLL